MCLSRNDLQDQGQGEGYGELVATAWTGWHKLLKTLVPIPVPGFTKKLTRIAQGLNFVIRILMRRLREIRGFCAMQHKFTPSKSRRLLSRLPSARLQMTVFACLFRSSTVSTAIPTTSRGLVTMVNKPLTESHETKSIDPHVAAAAEPNGHEVGSITKRWAF